MEYVEIKVLSWFSSYLSGRSQRVMLNGTLSDSSDLNFGVQQGSCLGPLLFILYASKLFDIINNHSPDSHGFADDDTQLYVSFKPDYPCDQCEAISVMESCVNDLRKWMIQDKLKLNDGKTELLIIGSKQQLQKLNPCHVRVGNANVLPVPIARDLGVWLNSNLSMSCHITKIRSHYTYIT